MQVIGAPAVRTASLADEHPQTPAADVGWQESIALVWFDPAQGIGGIHRIGQEPNYQGGETQSWNAFFTLTGTYFKRQQILAITPQDRPKDGFGVGGGDEVAGLIFAEPVGGVSAGVEGGAGVAG